MSLQEPGVLKGLPLVLFPIVLCARTTTEGVAQQTEKVYLIC